MMNNIQTFKKLKYLEKVLLDKYDLFKIKMEINLLKKLFHPPKTNHKVLNLSDKKSKYYSN